MGFGQSAESHTEQIRCQRCNGSVLQSIHNETVIDLVRKDDQLMLPGNLNDLFQDLLRIQYACRVIGIDDNDSLGTVRDLAADIIEIRIPVGFLITDIVHYRTSGQCGRSRPQRIIRRRNQNLIPLIQQCLHTQGDQLTDTISRINIVHLHVGQLFDLGILHDRLAGREKSPGIRIALTFRQLLTHIRDHFIRCTEPKGRRITDIQLEDLHSRLFHAGSFLHYRSAHIVKHIVEFHRFGKVTNTILIPDIPAGRHRILFCLHRFCFHGHIFPLQPKLIYTEGLSHHL